MKTAFVAALLLASVVAAQAKIAINGSQETGATRDRIVAVLSITLANQ